MFGREASGDTSGVHQCGNKTYLNAVNDGKCGDHSGLTEGSGGVPSQHDNARLVFGREASGDMSGVQQCGYSNAENDGKCGDHSGLSEGSGGVPSQLDNVNPKEYGKPDADSHVSSAFFQNLCEGEHMTGMQSTNSGTVNPACML